jgi:hypothetical protein
MSVGDESGNSRRVCGRKPYVYRCIFAVCRVARRAEEPRLSLRGRKAAFPGLPQFLREKTCTGQSIRGCESFAGPRWPTAFRKIGSNLRRNVMRRVLMTIVVLLTVCFLVADSASAGRRCRGGCGGCYTSCCDSGCGGCTTGCSTGCGCTSGCGSSCGCTSGCGGWSDCCGGRHHGRRGCGGCGCSSCGCVSTCNSCCQPAAPCCQPGMPQQQPHHGPAMAPGKAPEMPKAPPPEVMK